MKYILILFLTSVLFYSCSKEEPSKIEVFSTEAFAFDLGDSYEVNATTRVKGFNQTEEENNFYATVAYDLDIVTPAGDTIKSLISKVEDKKDSEKINEISLEAQFILDSTYVPGTYTVVFNVKDTNSDQTAVSSVDFQLGDE